MWTRSERASCPHELVERSPAYPLIQQPGPGARDSGLVQLGLIDRFSGEKKTRGRSAKCEVRSAKWEGRSAKCVLGARIKATGNTDQKGIPFFLPHLIQTLSDSDPENLRTCDPANLRPFDPASGPYCLPSPPIYLIYLPPAPFNIQCAPRGRSYRSW